MTPLSTEDTARLFTEFINQQGLWFEFKDWIDDKGYTLPELSIKKEN